MFLDFIKEHRAFTALLLIATVSGIAFGWLIDNHVLLGAVILVVWAITYGGFIILAAVELWHSHRRSKENR